MEKGLATQKSPGLALSSIALPSLPQMLRILQPLVALREPDLNSLWGDLKFKSNPALQSSHPTRLFFLFWIPQGLEVTETQPFNLLTAGLGSQGVDGLEWVLFAF